MLNQDETYKLFQEIKSIFMVPEEEGGYLRRSKLKRIHVQEAIDEAIITYMKAYKDSRAKLLETTTLEEICTEVWRLEKQKYRYEERHRSHHKSFDSVNQEGDIYEVVYPLSNMASSPATDAIIRIDTENCLKAMPEQYSAVIVNFIRDGTWSDNHNTTHRARQEFKRHWGR